MRAATGGNRDAAGQEVRNAVIRLRPRPGSAASSRYFSAAVLDSWHVDPDAAQDVLLAVSELVTNAVEHGAGEIMLELVNQAGRCLIVRVVDRGQGANPALVPLSPDSARSRGLAIVAAVSSAWGHRADDAGLCVWAEFPLVRLDRL